MSKNPESNQPIDYSPPSWKLSTGTMLTELALGHLAGHQMVSNEAVTPFFLFLFAGYSISVPLTFRLRRMADKISHLRSQTPTNSVQQLAQRHGNLIHDVDNQSELVTTKIFTAVEFLTGVAGGIASQLGEPGLAVPPALVGAYTAYMLESRIDKLSDMTYRLRQCMRI